MDFIPPDNISEFPLRPAAAKRLLQQLATSHTERILLNAHARQRMAERRISLRQILAVLSSRHSRFTELPHLTPAGDWKLNMLGVAAGERIEVVVVLKRVVSDPAALVVTVMIH